MKKITEQQLADKYRHQMEAGYKTRRDLALERFGASIQHEELETLINAQWAAIAVLCAVVMVLIWSK